MPPALVASDLLLSGPLALAIAISAAAGLVSFFSPVVPATGARLPLLRRWSGGRGEPGTCPRRDSRSPYRGAPEALETRLRARADPDTDRSVDYTHLPRVTFSNPALDEAAGTVTAIFGRSRVGDL